MHHTPDCSLAPHRPTTGALNWWERRSFTEKLVVGFVAVALAGAIAYAVVTGGAILVYGDTVLMIGAAAARQRL